jgi:hypothetical protein
MPNIKIQKTGAVVLLPRVDLPTSDLGRSAPIPKTSHSKQIGCMPKDTTDYPIRTHSVGTSSSFSVLLRLAGVTSPLSLLESSSNVTFAKASA